jgi:SAM-dependent methyltransferase
MARVLFWYRVLVFGGAILLIKSVTWLVYEVRCIAARREEDRLFPLRRPAVAICALIGTGCVGVLLYILNVTLVLPTLLLIEHFMSRAIHRLAVWWRPAAGREGSDAPVARRNWHYYDGMLYETAIEPLAREMRHETAAHVSEHSDVLDICCGTGGLVCHLAEKCASVTGVDHAHGMIKYARMRQVERGLNNVTFTHADARSLPDYGDRRFDHAILSLALHEMPRASGLRVLREATRVSREVVIVDYAVPLPTHTQGLMFRYLEVVAGLNHLKGLLNYSRHKGLDSLIEDAGLVVKSDRTAMSQCIRILAVANEKARKPHRAASQP